MEYTDFGNKPNHAGLNHMKVDNEAVHRYENVNDEEHCVVNITEKYLSCIPRHDNQFYFRPLPDDGSGVPKFGNQPVGQNKLAL